MRAPYHRRRDYTLLADVEQTLTQKQHPRPGQTSAPSSNAWIASEGLHWTVKFSPNNILFYWMTLYLFYPSYSLKGWFPFTLFFYTAWRLLHQNTVRFLSRKTKYNTKISNNVKFCHLKEKKYFRQFTDTTNLHPWEKDFLNASLLKNKHEEKTSVLAKFSFYTKIL